MTCHHFDERCCTEQSEMWNLAARTKSTRLIMRMCCLLFDLKPLAETHRQDERWRQLLCCLGSDVVRGSQSYTYSFDSQQAGLTVRRYLCFCVFITTGESIVFWNVKTCIMNFVHFAYSFKLVRIKWKYSSDFGISSSHGAVSKTECFFRRRKLH